MGFDQKLTESTEQLHFVVSPFFLCYTAIQTAVSFTNDHFHRNRLIVQLADDISSTFHEHLEAYYPKHFEYASGRFLYRLNKTKPRPYAYLQLFVGELMFYLRYLCLIAHSGVQHMLCCVFVFLCLVAYVASFSGLSISD
jgi:hypothetical protein